MFVDSCVLYVFVPQVGTDTLTPCSVIPDTH